MGKSSGEWYLRDEDAVKTKRRRQRWHHPPLAIKLQGAGHPTAIDLWRELVNNAVVRGTTVFGYAVEVAD
jgi:hypothetical protein